MMSKPAATAIGEGIFTTVALEGTLIAHEQANTLKKMDDQTKKKGNERNWKGKVFESLYYSM